MLPYSWHIISSFFTCFSCSSFLNAYNNSSNNFPIFTFPNSVASQSTQFLYPSFLQVFPIMRVFASLSSSCFQMSANFPSIIFSVSWSLSSFLRSLVTVSLFWKTIFSLGLSFADSKYYLATNNDKILIFLLFLLLYASSS